MAINEITSIDVKTLPPFKRLIMTIGELPTSYLESMTYAELLMWFCNFLQEKVLPTINTNADALQEVITYLENLDLQDEVDHKLDEMAESGELQEIVADYLNSKALFGFDTVADMKLATNFIDGSYAKTLGYYTKNDGGSATYKIRQITNDDVVDDMFIIELADDNLIAELIFGDKVELKQIGAKGNNTDDDSAYLIQAITKCNNVIVNDGTYYINQTVNINKDNVTIKGQTYRHSILTFGDNGNITFQGTSITASGTHRKFLTIENLELLNKNFDNERLTPFLNLICCAYVKIINCWITGKGKQVLFWECFDSRVLNTDIEWGGSATVDSISGLEFRSTNGGDSSLPTYEYTNNIYFYGCRFESHIGKCVGTSGTNTNKLIFESCKFESYNCLTQNAIYINNASNIYFTDCVYAGSLANTKNYVYINDTNDFKIDGYMEHSRGTYSNKKFLYASGSGRRIISIRLNNQNAYDVDYKNFGFETYQNGIYIDGDIHVNNYSNKDILITNRGANIATLENGDTTLNYTVLENGFVYVTMVGTYGTATPQVIRIKNNTLDTQLMLSTVGSEYVSGFMPVNKGDIITCPKNTSATAYVSIKYNRGFNI